HVMLHELTYTNLDDYLADHLRLVREAHFDGQFGTIMRDESRTWRFVIEVGKFFTPPNEPNIRALEGDLRFASAAAPARMTYRDYLFPFEARTAALPAGPPRPVITLYYPAWTTHARAS